MYVLRKTQRIYSTYDFHQADQPHAGPDPVGLTWSRNQNHRALYLSPMEQVTKTQPLSLSQRSKTDSERKGSTY